MSERLPGWLEYTVQEEAKTLIGNWEEGEV